MKHTDFHNEARRVLVPRGKSYGDVRKNHKRIARIASELIGYSLSERDIALVLVAVKLGRLAQTPAHADSYVDAINYLAFAGEFATDAVG